MKKKEKFYFHKTLRFDGAIKIPEEILRRFKIARRETLDIIDLGDFIVISKRWRPERRIETVIKMKNLFDIQQLLISKNLLMDLNPRLCKRVRITEIPKMN